MVRIMKKDGNRLEGIGERIDVRLTLIEEALGMTPGDPEIYGNWIASKAPEPEAKAGSYDLAPTGDAGATLNLKAQGDAKNVKEDIAKDKTVATITWTFAAGNAAGGISVDDSWEGNHEMGID